MMESSVAFLARQILLWGEENQEILTRSTLLVAGVGGVGCTAAEVLSRCGVGKLILIDNKEVDPPDLGRQSLYTIQDLGRPKAVAAAERLSKISGLTEILPLEETIGEMDLSAVLGECDGVLDCLDNFEARFALEAELPGNSFIVHSAILGGFGQVTTTLPERTVRLRDLYAGLNQPCSPVPVAAPIVYILGSIMAQEALNNLWGKPELAGELLVVDANHFFFSRETIKRPLTPGGQPSSSRSQRRSQAATSL